MSPVDKALWYIESHFDSTITLDDIAASACVSKYHLLRAFSAMTGLSVMRYLRGRRLTNAARRLALGAEDILPLAIECGYASHEAFTRAFRDQFGVTPESVRARGHVNDLRLLEAINTSVEPLETLATPRFERRPPLLVAGIVRHYGGIDEGAEVPSQWQQFARHASTIRGRIGEATYGVCYNTDDEGSMDYLCGVEVEDFASVPRELTRLRVPGQRYVVFHHAGHITAVVGTWKAIWNGWLPESGHEPTDAPLFELYGGEFNRETGLGGVELWVPIRS